MGAEGSVGVHANGFRLKRKQFAAHPFGLRRRAQRAATHGRSFRKANLAHVVAQFLQENSEVQRGQEYGIDALCCALASAMQGHD
jgi:hypothetical protein